MSEHTWIKIEITPILVIANGDEFPIVVVDPDEQSKATYNSQYGCGRCDVSLSELSVNTLCPGNSDEDCEGAEGDTTPLFHFDEHPDRP